MAAWLLFAKTKKKHTANSVTATVASHSPCLVTPVNALTDITVSPVEEDSQGTHSPM
jgi:hypothetical protein